MVIVMGIVSRRGVVVAVSFLGERVFVLCSGEGGRRWLGLVGSFVVGRVFVGRVGVCFNRLLV